MQTIEYASHPLEDILEKIPESWACIFVLLEIDDEKIPENFREFVPKTISKKVEPEYREGSKYWETPLTREKREWLKTEIEKLKRKGYEIKQIIAGESWISERSAILAYKDKIYLRVREMSKIEDVSYFNSFLKILKIET